MIACRGCGKTDLIRVLDLGKTPAADHFPRVAEPVCAEEMSHSLAMELCRACGLAQLADDDTIADEPRGVEPQALRDQAGDAIERVAAAGWLRGDSVFEFGSPHGGTWIPLLAARGYTPVKSAPDVVLDCFGIMHEKDQRAAFDTRSQLIRPGGVLLLQYHSLMTIVRQGQWNALRHGHFAYYSLTALMRLLGEVGLRVATAWEFDLYGGTVLLAAVRENVHHDDVVDRILATEEEFGITDPEVISDLQRRADLHVEELRSWLESESSGGRSVFGYGAASRAVALFSRAGLDARLLAAVADASPAKHRRRMPGTDIPIISPAELLAANPDRVLLTVPDLLAEVAARYPELDGRWQVDGQ
ncbi:methyltransferase domain-containing protein [Mycolicibacterium diernhoferi]|uniref:Transferase n=1 Tax=Mycolicibacterium diernhoferi TaxID=1801 RepID=A0A1Q4HDE6_9MYCO|nr:methyltransferase domain-containing protein [Mycolicibacterium diernhoferi]OJZ65550.1 transferase [Mycolicibacterium diernhoferi]OPE56261.1 transferase [Mycolicibacterium diernhoferi]PEG55925.1 transferase [Mycolicibacterium diernhoferi]QYL22291.1 methyltransferase domain-containing protein [Mycolicibacterium diernhoferi]